jgi:hypothetical protein
MSFNPEKDAAEEKAVRELGDRIGYGRMMQLAEQIWRTLPYGDKGAHSVGPCVGLLVPCPHPDGPNCDWCCGSGRVTKRVLAAMKS